MQRRSIDQPEAIRALDAARVRVQAITSTHRRLRLGLHGVIVRTDEMLSTVIDDIADTLPLESPIKITHDIEPLEIEARDGVSLSVLVSELVTNATRHAFSEAGGAVNIVFAKPEERAAFVEVTDDGRGYSLRESAAQGLGIRIVVMLARQFGGDVQCEPLNPNDALRPGTRIRIDLHRLQPM